MKALVLYHANCVDGFGAAYAVWKKLQDDAEYVPVSYGELEYNGQDRVLIINNEQYLTEERDIYIVDFSVGKPMLDALLHDCSHLYLMDHHKTAFENLLGKSPKPTDMRVENTDKMSLWLDMQRSGARLAFEVLHPGEYVPDLIMHIDDYDRWQFQLEDTKPLNKYLWAVTPWTFETFDTLANDLYALEQAKSEGRALLKVHNDQVATVVHKATCRITIPGVHIGGGAVNAPQWLASDAGHEIAVMYNSFGVVWYLHGGDTVHCSIRGNGKCDVSAIATQFGGGGHHNAAGFTVPAQEFFTWLS